MIQHATTAVAAQLRGTQNDKRQQNAPTGINKAGQTITHNYNTAIVQTKKKHARATSGKKKKKRSSLSPGQPFCFRHCILFCFFFSFPTTLPKVPHLEECRWFGIVFLFCFASPRSSAVETTTRLRKIDYRKRCEPKKSQGWTISPLKAHPAAKERKHCEADRTVGRLSEISERDAKRGETGQQLLLEQHEALLSVGHGDRPPLAH